MSNIEVSTWAGRAGRVPDHQGGPEVGGGGDRACLPPPADRDGLRRDVDLDRPWLGFLTQRQPDRENAVLVLGAHPVGIDSRWKRERTSERAVTPLHMVELFLLHAV